MSTSHTTNRTAASAFTAQGRQTHFQHRSTKFHYRHIVVPTGMSSADHTALLLGFTLAALHEAQLTVLHVLRPSKRQRSDLGLDAFELLHEAADVPLSISAPDPQPEKVRLQVRRFLERTVSQRLREDVTWREECCSGEVAESVVAYANKWNADLVILSTKPSWWWLPLRPPTVRTIEGAARCDVIVVRSGGGARRTI